MTLFSFEAPEMLLTISLHPANLQIPFIFHTKSFPSVSQTPFGLIRMTVVVVPFLYVGTLISKNFAALLEEHDIFVPEDDDDDD